MLSDFFQSDYDILMEDTDIIGGVPKKESTQISSILNMPLISKYVVNSSTNSVMTETIIAQAVRNTMSNMATLSRDDGLTRSYTRDSTWIGSTELRNMAKTPSNMLNIVKSSISDAATLARTARTTYTQTVDAINRGHQMLVHSVLKNTPESDERDAVVDTAIQVHNNLDSMEYYDEIGGSEFIVESDGTLERANELSNPVDNNEQTTMVDPDIDETEIGDDEETIPCPTGAKCMGLTEISVTPSDSGDKTFTDDEKIVSHVRTKKVTTTALDNMAQLKYGYIEPPKILIESMQSFQNHITELVYTNMITLNITPTIMKQVQGKPFYVFKLDDNTTPFNRFVDMMERIFATAGITPSKVWQAAKSNSKFSFVCSSISFNYGMSNNAEISFISKFANLLSGTLRQWGTMFGQTQAMHSFGGTATEYLQQGAQSLSEIFNNTPILGTATDTINKLLMDQTFQDVVPGMAAGATFDSPKIVTSSSSTVNLRCAMLLTADLPADKIIKQRIIEPLIVIMGLSTPMNMYDYLQMIGESNVSPALKTLYFMPLYSKLEWKYGLDPTAASMSDGAGSTNTNTWYKFDGIITNVSVTNTIVKFGRVIGIQVEFDIVPVYNTLFASDAGPDEAGSMLTLSWFAENIANAFSGV